MFCFYPGMLPALVLCVSGLASIGFISHCLRKAPEGWEDNAGFHYGRQVATVRRTAMPVAAFKPQLFPLTRSASTAASVTYQ